MKSTTKKNRLFLLDGMALAYRAYFSFISRPLINSKGENTSAIYGFVTTLMKILNEEKPEYIAVVFDTPQPTFRHVMYSPYKATRQKMPEDMVPQIERLKETVRAFNVPSLELDGYEADDLIGTLARRAEKEGIHTYLVTGDKDFMQLISPLICMYKPGKRGDEWEIIDTDAVVKRFGVGPDHVVDVLGLTGDASDNVPGVSGIGEKTAIPLVQKYGSIENIYKNLQSVEQKGVQKKLRDHQEEAFLSKKLITLDTDVPIPVDLHRLTAQAPDNDKLTRLFSEFEFKSLIRKIKPSAQDTSEPARRSIRRSSLSWSAGEPAEFIPSLREFTDITQDEHSYHLVEGEKSFNTLMQMLSRSKFFIFDTETTSTNPLEAKLVGISFSLKPREAWYVPVASEKNSAQAPEVGSEERIGNDLFSDSGTKRGKKKFVLSEPEQPKLNTGFPLPFIVKHLSPIFADPSIKKGGQNVKYDMLILASHGIEVRGVAFDTMVANYILRPDGQHGLDKQAAEHLAYNMIPYSALVSDGKKTQDIRDVPVEKVAEYSNEDSDMTFRLFELHGTKLDQEHLMKLCEEVEFPLVSVLARMEYTGVKLDVDFLADMSKELERILDNLVQDIYNDAGEKFNINSTQQLGKILFEKLKLSVGRKTKTGFSTDVGVLETLQHGHPIIGRILEYRQLQKLKSTYIDALPSLIKPRTGRVHTSFNQTITATGRLSSSNPNLQNIPIRTEMGSRIRKAFIPGNKDMLILSADYSQIELRIMAHISGDEGLTTAFNNGEDIHTTTAEKVFGVGSHEVTREMRRKAKEVNFGIMYGIGPYGLSSRLDITQQEAKGIIDTYFKRFPKVNQYIFDTIATAKKTGYVSTLLGRRRYLPDINSRNQNIRSNAERQAINMPIQGTAADMIKIAMVKIDRLFQEKPFKSKMLLQVHDELVFEIPEKEKEKVQSIIRETMEDALPLSVPVEVDIGIGKNWLEAH